MAFTAAEKMRRRRQKLKDEGKYEEYKEKHRQTAKKSRTKKKNELDHMTSIEREKLKRQQRKRSRESVAKSRMKKKEQKAIQFQQSPYKSRCSLGKAIARTKRSLPNSPRQKKAVLRNLIESIVPSHERNIVVQNYKGKDALNDETIQIVQAFYLRDDISQQAPGMKDVITAKNNDGKQRTN